MKKYIVCTTINSPTEAIEKFDSMPDWHLIVVGDLKTPRRFRLRNGTYLNPGMQERMDRRLSDLIGWNCVQRRNFGFIASYKQGADIVATVDDDNIPYLRWGHNLLIGRAVSVNFHKIGPLVFDPFSVTNHRNLWHRGFPLDLVESKNRNITSGVSRRVFQIQADFWNGDPDVDAIERVAGTPKCRFHNNIFPFASNRISPFNSQNTFLLREVIPHYFMFPGIGRMDDIWGSFYVQSLGYSVAYSMPSVLQVRNKHSLCGDIGAEALGYQHSFNFIKALRRNPRAALRKFIPQRSLDAFRHYREHF